jgi:hypothetical protein
VNGEHNHEMAKNLEGHILVGRLKPKEKECVHQLTRNLVAPKNILNMLNEKNKVWKIYRAPEAESWEAAFLDRMAEFYELMENKKALLPKKKTNEDDLIVIG